MPRPRRDETSEEAKARWERERRERGGTRDDARRDGRGEKREKPREAQAKDELGQMAKRGRPSKAAKSAAFDSMEPAIARAVELPFKIVASRYGRKWLLGNDEKKELGHAATEVLKIYAPEVSPEQFAVGYLAFVLLGIVAVRMTAEEETPQERFNFGQPEPSATGMPGPFAGATR